MRVTGGILRSRPIAVPKGERVRPTQDRVRLALFSSLAARIPGCRFLDLFAGSGAVGLEAWSRGAAFVCWVERDPVVLRTLRRNIGELCPPGEGGGGRIVAQDSLRFLEGGADGGAFDIVFADPPYDRDMSRDWAGRILRSLRGRAILSRDGIVAIEQATEEPEIVCAGSRLLARKTYGGTRLSLLSAQE
jgi:16S rRNA (guanine966-N2)-methyltransferase